MSQSGKNNESGDATNEELNDIAKQIREKRDEEEKLLRKFDEKIKATEGRVEVLGGVIGDVHQLFLEKKDLNMKAFEQKPMSSRSVQVEEKDGDLLAGMLDRLHSLDSALEEVDKKRSELEQMQAARNESQSAFIEQLRSAKDEEMMELQKLSIEEKVEKDFEESEKTSDAVEVKDDKGVVGDDE